MSEGERGLPVRKMVRRCVYGLVASIVAVSVGFPVACADASSGVFDDFNGPAGADPDPGMWSYRTGHGWDGGEQTYVTDGATLDGRGDLVIRAFRGDGGYESGRVQTTMGLGYGRTSARIKMPAGQGLWPAFWMVGIDDDSAEIDIVELVSNATTYYSTIHGPSTGPDRTYQVQSTGGVGDLSRGYHEYWVEHLPDRITIGIDGTTTATFTPDGLPPGAQWVFDRPMSVILSMAVGGDWAGPPDSSTRFPAQMSVDWFRWEPM
jgi:beta-glucanase (GH16 family)